MAGKKLLITGFDPFGGEHINPAWEAVSGLPPQIGEIFLTKLQVPTVFDTAAEMVLKEARILQPDAILCVGQAGGRKAVTPEMVAINLRYASIPDNAGNQPQDEPVVPGAPAAYFATLPVREMVRRIKEAGIPAEVSYSAGTFVCNDLIYTVLHEFAGTNTRAAFLHVPYLPEQVKAKEGVASMPLETIIRALKAAIQAISLT